MQSVRLARCRKMVSAAIQQSKNEKCINSFTSSSGLSTFEESGSEYVPSKSQTDFSDSCENSDNFIIQSDSDRISSGSKKSDILPIQESLLFCSETIEHWHNNNLCLQTQTQSLEARPNVQENDQFLNYDNVGNSLSIVQTLSSTNEAEMESFQNTVTVRKYKKKKTFCRLCTLEVTNFERHLERQHKDNEKVHEMLSFPKKSNERKKVISLLRNEGHFEEFLKGNIRPVYKIHDKPSTNYYPCANCKGLYSRKYLFRHNQKCVAASISNDPTKIKHLSASQTLVAASISANNTLHKLRVKEEVFNIMRADEIAFVAKSDALICHFGEQYLKKHSRQQMATVCSNKMRELARLLIEFRIVKNDKSIRLCDLLDPTLFDLVIECAKKIGGYDATTKTYRAPSLSSHIGTSLKQISDLLIRLLLKKDISINILETEAKIKQVKQFRELVNTQWTTEISSLAFKNLNETKSNKPIILPLTKDIMKFKTYVTDVANKAIAILNNNNNDSKEYRNLVDATLTLTILYNRRRIGDVQYTKLETYLKNFSTINQDECLNTLTDAEKLLTKHYKRIVTGGKGSRAIVILFPQNLQNFVNKIVEIRQNTNLVPETNPYLFAFPKSKQWARGDVAIRKFAQKADLQDPRSISSNKLRKQIATVMQILNLESYETEQFAQFMGHTEKTHNEFYKLPQDIYQTAKVSKLLILMDKGGGHKYKGKSLNEIDINPEVDLAESDNEEETESTITNMNIVVDHFEGEASTSAECRKAVKKTGRTPWSSAQIHLVKKEFKSHIDKKQAPKKHECEEFLKKHPHLFKDKDWVRVKTYVYNTYRIK